MIELLLVLAIAGILVWFLASLPMPEVFRRAIYVVAAICLLVYVARFFGVVTWWPRHR